MFYRKERKEHRAGRVQSKTWSQKDAKSFVFHFLDPIFLTQDVANSCKAPSAFFAFSAVKHPPSFPLFASVQFFSPGANTQTSRKFCRKERKEHRAVGVLHELHEFARRGEELSQKHGVKKIKTEFVSHFFDPIFLTQDVFPGHLRANSCKAPSAFFAFSAVKQSPSFPLFPLFSCFT